MDLNGKTFGKLFVKERIGYKYGNHINYSCTCECGKETEATYQLLVLGNKTSCGCARKGINSTHGLSKTRFYRIWFSMKSRCKDKKDISYKNYGGRGITYCEKWDKFEGFYEDMLEGYNENLTIDRINNNGNYCKSNCRWATYKLQANNKSTNNVVTIDGITKNIGEWLDFYKLSKNTYFTRIKNGWNQVDAITKSPKEYKEKIHFNGIDKSLSGWASHLGMQYKTLYRRMYIKKYPIEKVLSTDKYN